MGRRGQRRFSQSCEKHGEYASKEHCATPSQMVANDNMKDMRFVLVLVTAGWLFAQDGMPRLAAAGKLWSRIQFTHPGLASREIDWDGAFAKAAPKETLRKRAFNAISKEQPPLWTELALT
jgi:hypothetical protein